MVEGIKRLDSEQKEHLHREYSKGRNQHIENRRGRWFCKSERSKYLPPISWVKFLWDEYTGNDPVQNDADKSAAFANACKQMGYARATLNKRFTRTDLSDKGIALLNLPQNQKALTAIIYIINRK